MVIAVSTGPGLLLVNTITSLYPSIISLVFPTNTTHAHASHTFSKRHTELPVAQRVILGCLMPILVILSGIFAGLTLGYMSLDETQLNVLSISGTPEQKRYAEKIKPIRQNGHLLLVTLLLSNMVVNETLPVVADHVLGGDIQGVVVSTVLIVIFAEVIPQSICTRYGLWVGAMLAPVVRVLLWTMGIIAWPVAKLLEIVLGPHHGIIYRRTELKELIAMHSSTGHHGGDLNNDTVTIIGATLDLQEKVVRQAMTPIKDVFMLSVESNLDYETLRKICATGHSRVPVYEEVEVPTSDVIEARNKAGSSIVASPILDGKDGGGKTMTVKKIIGILLVKQCVLLDPSDAIPLRQIPLNKVLFVPNDESLLGMLDKFQEGGSHIAVVSRFSSAKAKSVKKAAKSTLTQRIRQTVGISDDSSTSSESSENEDSENDAASAGTRTSKSKPRDDTVPDSSTDKAATLRGNTIPGSNRDDDQGDVGDPEAGVSKRRFMLRRKKGRKNKHKTEREKEKQRDIDIEAGEVQQDKEKKGGGLWLSSKEQITPADAVLAEESAKEFLQILDSAIMPLGIITLEDVLEELIGEEIYDEFDPHHQGAQLSSFVPPESDAGATVSVTSADNPGFNRLDKSMLTVGHESHTSTGPGLGFGLGHGSAIIKPIALKAMEGFGVLTGRSNSAPPVPREQIGKFPWKSGTPPVTGDNESNAPPSNDINEEPNITRLEPPAPPISPSRTPGADSRTTASPTTLEAYLLERKRRGVPGGGGTPRVVTPVPGPGVKGKGFKSSPVEKNTTVKGKDTI